jgi:hypothetical protein
MSSTSVFPGFGKLFSFGSTGSTRDFIADVELGANPVAVTRGESVAQSPSACWAMGSNKPNEIVWTRVVGPVLLSATLVEVLRTNGFSGWDVYPVPLRGKAGESLPSYFGLIVHGRCGAIDPSRSVKAMKEYPAGSFPIVKGLGFEESSWDGADFFMPSDGTAWVFVTERVKRVLASTVRNARFEALDQIEQIPIA